MKNQAERQCSPEPIGNDAILIDKTLAGDADSFNQLVTKYWPMAYQLCYQWTKNHAESEDITQEAFVKVQKYLKKLDDKEKFPVWFYGLVSQLIKERHRSRRIVREEPIVIELEDKKSPKPADKLLMRDALNSLPEDFRLVLILRFYKDMSCDEIARHLKEPLGSVTSKLSRAYRALREKLK
ncbi:MAG: sigma-70 family RNA polymerase sigma factor [Planctomycetota bacterium]